jgi:pimeloyl-ACP methyl ester carboxylesterase
MAPGATGTAEGLRGAAEHLAQSYTVAIYDRRGFSRSHLDGPQDFDRRLDTDADDLRRLAEHLSDEPATILGVSSGATVALHVLIHHPAVVGTLISFEPPAVRLLPDGQRWVDSFHAVYELYQRSGIEAALKQFREETFATSDRVAMARAMDLNTSGQILANLAYWFEHELRQYPATNLDLDLLRATADRIVPAAGRDSHGYPCREATVELGKRLGQQVIDLPGGHVGCMTRPAEFTTELVKALTDRAA